MATPHSDISSHVAAISVTSCKGLAILGVILFLQYTFFSHHPTLATEFLSPSALLQPPPANTSSTPTNLNHIVFGLVGSTKAWKHRKSYVESWWRPRKTRGYLFLDNLPTQDLLPWSSNSPPFRVSDDNSKLLEESKHVAPIQVRIVHAILEVFREGDKGVRWFVMGDDDSIFFVDNLVDVLSKYDHTKYVYVGGHSENLKSNFWHSFEMGFGGAGFILSYRLAEMLVTDLENCLRRYPKLNVADQILMSCVADFGISVTFEKGLHQESLFGLCRSIIYIVLTMYNPSNLIDLGGDISGLLSAHPQAPLLSLHHFDMIDPIFPSMNRFESANHLLKIANVDQSRLLQQTVCYHRETNWSFSFSWGYSAHIYEQIIPRSILKKPLETFRPWIANAEPPHYLFNTRPLSRDPCEAPHVFSFKSVKIIHRNKTITSYIRVSPRGLPPCSLTGNHSADHVSKVQVLSTTKKLIKDGRSECCDIEYQGGLEMAKVKLRTCYKDEIIA